MCHGWLHVNRHSQIVELAILQAYQAARNTIVSMYREDLLRRLGFVDCRGRLQGDVNALRRVWKFLDHWGIINFQAEEAARNREASFIVTSSGMCPSATTT